MKSLLQMTLGRLFRCRTLKSIQFDLIRARARWKVKRRDVVPPLDRLHLGCGSRIIPAWHNVDVRGSDYDWDLACGWLPWKDESFTCVVSQHVIDDLDLETELIPLLQELHRVMRVGGELWLTCPDLTRVCAAYLEDRCEGLIRDRQRRIPGYSTRGLPSTQFFNDLVYAGGLNMNFFDFELLEYVLRESAGFTVVTRTSEEEMLDRLSDFPRRNDQEQSLYVRATRGPSMGRS